MATDIRVSVRTHRDDVSVSRLVGHAAMKVQGYDPIQALLCWYRQQRQVYCEPLRALPLPDPNTPKIRNRPGCVRVSEDHSPIADREECCLIRVLDASAEMEAVARQVHTAIMGLSPREKKLVEHFSAYPTSDLQFDFRKAARDRVASERGLCPCCGASNYDAWQVAQNYRANDYREQWVKIRANLKKLLDNDPKFA